MIENDQTKIKLNPGSMIQIFLESHLIEQIKQIQKNENLNDERDVIVHLIQNYFKKNVFDGTTLKEKKNLDFLQTPFDGKFEMQKLEKILARIESEDFIKKLPQHEIYGKSNSGMMHRFHTKIFPVKFSLLCLAKMIVDQDTPWIDLNELKNYTLESAKVFVQKFDSSLIKNKFRFKTGFPVLKLNDFKSQEDAYLTYARSSKRFTEQFVGRKLQKHEGVQMAGACFEMGLIDAKVSYSNDEKLKSFNDVNYGKILVTLSDSGKEFATFKNNLIDFIYKNTLDEPHSIFSNEETSFYFRKILPEFEFENKFVKYLMDNEKIEHTSQIKSEFKRQFEMFYHSKFPNADVLLQDNSVRIHSNTVMSRLMEFGVFAKDPKFKSGPYTRMEKIDNLV